MYDSLVLYSHIKEQNRTEHHFIIVLYILHHHYNTVIIIVKRHFNIKQTKHKDRV
jgi:hypothetical protein